MSSSNFSSGLVCEYHPHTCPLAKASSLKASGRISAIPTEVSFPQRHHVSRQTWWKTPEHPPTGNKSVTLKPDWVRIVSAIAK